MILKELFDSGKFVITSEVAPPKGTDISEMKAEVEYLKGKVDAINVTDLQSSVMRLGSLAVCHLVKDWGFEPVFQLTCRDRNRLALQSDLISAAVLGVENVLILTGDYPTLGDHPHAKPVFDMDSVTLLQIAKGLMEGHDMSGNELKGVPKFCMGAVVNPGMEPIEPQIIKMEKKIQAGATFFQTQGVFEVDKFEKFIKATEYLKVPIMAGIIFVKSAGAARYMNKNVAGVFIPDDMVNEITNAKVKSEATIEIASRIISGLKDMCNGIHIMSLGWSKYVPAVLDKAGLVS